MLISDRRTVYPRHARRHRRRGQALVEFAIIAFVLSAIVAGLLGILVLALGSFQNNIAAESAGRILDHHEEFNETNFLQHFLDDDDDPLTVSDGFEDITAKQVYRFLTEFKFEVICDPDEAPVMTTFFDESLLIMSSDDWFSLDRNCIPPLNQALLGQYIYDPDRDAYRYPGAIAINDATMQETVLVPILDFLNDTTGETADGIERSFNVNSVEPADAYPVADNWVAPITVVRCPDCGVNDGPAFQIVLFHPSQPASMVNLRVVRDPSDNQIISQTPVAADDAALASQLDKLDILPTGYSFSTPDVNDQFGASSSRGKYGLGESNAFLIRVRPFRLVFETASLFRLKPDTLVAKYEGGGTPISLTDGTDQYLDLSAEVIDREPDALKLVYPDGAPASDDSEYRALVVPGTGVDSDTGLGIWKVTVAADFEPEPPAVWEEDHELELRLYKNGVMVSLIATHDVTSSQADPAVADEAIPLIGQSIVQAEVDDVLQVRVFTQRATGSTDVRLTGDPASNWVTFERLDD